MFKKKNLKVALFVGGSLLIISFTFYFYQIFFNPNIMVAKPEGVLLIPEGADIHQVVDSLYEYQYLEDVVSFMFVSKIFGYQEAIKPGRYVFKKKEGQKGLTNTEVVRILKSGAQSPVRLVFHNIRLKEDLVARICRPLTADPQELLQLLNDSAFVADLGFTPETVIAMFIPNTYEMYWNTDARKLIERMKREYDKFWTDERKQKAQALGLTPIQVATLASIVQAETAKEDEKPIVAGLYLNRLKIGMLLNSDPTVIFAARDFTIKRVLKRHLEIESPYNTYKYVGLPPGPINVPAPTSIDAVLNYQTHEYLYMCAHEDFTGYHRFAVTFRQHLENARRYQKALNEAGIMQ
jgi:UPF0755 protein